MLLSSCPRCHDSIRIPALAKETSVIRCPRCHEEFPLTEVFSSLPPEAEIISGPGSEITVPIEASLADTSEYSLAGEPSVPKTDFQIKDSGPLASGAPMAKIDSGRPSRKPKKAEPNVMLEFAKIIVGGAAGLLIAVMMIMWFGHQDVFKIVPKLPPQAYFLVPEELRTAEMRELANEGASPEEASPEVDVPVESIPSDEPTDDEPADDTPDADDQVSRNNPADESPLAAAFQQQVNAAKQTAAQKKPDAKPKPKSKPEGRKVNAEMPISEPIVAKDPPAKPAPLPQASETDKKEVPAKPTQPKPTQPTPIDPMLIEMVTEASAEMGPIGAEIPPLPTAGQADDTNVGSVDLSPVDGDDK